MFYSARIKLTAWYLFIIMCVSSMFSIVIYRGLVGEIERFERIQRYRIQRNLQQGDFFPRDDQFRFSPAFPYNPELLEETKKRVLIILVVINTGIIVIAGGLGYVLAGRTLSPIQEMVHEQNRFISDASHELRTPLTSLKSAFEVFLRDKYGTLSQSKKIIEESITDVNKLQSLSDSLLLLAQYQKPNGNVRFKKLELITVIDAAIKKIYPLAKQKNIRINKNIRNITLSANEDGLTELFVILLDNAVKYSNTLTQVSISASKIDYTVKVEVKDQGIGIAKKDIPFIFDRFYRADKSRSNDKAGGYGLGLSIAKKISEFHHGSIETESQRGKGTSMIVKLPLRG